MNWFMQVNHPVYQDRRGPPERLYGQALLNFTLNKVNLSSDPQLCFQHRDAVSGTQHTHTNTATYM
jgi:hypothetical protein